MTNEQIPQLMKSLDPDWILSENGTSIIRKFKVKNFSDAMDIAHQAATLAERVNHHPDICLGWGYCHVSFTTHSSKSLSKLDIQCAQQLDVLLAAS